MIVAWVLYRDCVAETFHFEELGGTSYTSTDPETWGLPIHCDIVLVLQSAQFLQAWVEGGLLKGR